MLSTLQAGMHANHIGVFKKMYILGLIVTGQQGMGLHSACLQISCYEPLILKLCHVVQSPVGLRLPFLW